jgi:hypothetical protein
MLTFLSFYCPKGYTPDHLIRVDKYNVKEVLDKSHLHRDSNAGHIFVVMASVIVISLPKQTTSFTTIVFNFQATGINLNWTRTQDIMSKICPL